MLDDFADLSGYQVYACGGPAMVDAARATFVGTRGAAADEFFADSFTYARRGGEAGLTRDLAPRLHEAAASLPNLPRPIPAAIQPPASSRSEARA